jgi:hypothetical protein
LDLGTTHLAEATLAWDFFRGQFTKQSCPLFFRYIEDKAWHHPWMRMRWGMLLEVTIPSQKKYNFCGFV